MRFLADESLEDPVVDALRDDGHDVVAVRDTSPGLSDPDVLAWSEHDGRVLITNDTDFGTLVFHTGQLSTGVVLLRFGDIPGKAKARCVCDTIRAIGPRLPLHFAVVTPEQTRLRALRTSGEAAASADSGDA